MKKDEELSPDLRRVAREGGTETPGSGKYLHEKAKGMYHCAVCGAELFSSETKFDSGTGWPSFTEPVNLEQIELRDDSSGGNAAYRDTLQELRRASRACIQRSARRQGGQALLHQFSLSGLGEKGLGAAENFFNALRVLRPAGADLILEHHPPSEEL